MFVFGKPRQKLGQDGQENRTHHCAKHRGHAAQHDHGYQLDGFEKTVVGDLVWPFLAILGVSWILSIYGDFLVLVRWIATVIFLVLGVLVIRSAGKPIGADSRLMRSGRWAGFVAGVAIIAGNPKAILFYMGMLPAFFDVSVLTWPDIAMICLVSMAIPLLGNLVLALFVDRARLLLKSPQALRRMNISAGGLLICVGLAIPFI